MWPLEAVSVNELSLMKDSELVAILRHLQKQWTEPTRLAFEVADVAPFGFQFSDVQGQDFSVAISEGRLRIFPFEEASLFCTLRLEVFLGLTVTQEWNLAYFMSHWADLDIDGDPVEMWRVARYLAGASEPLDKMLYRIRNRSCANVLLETDRLNIDEVTSARRQNLPLKAKRVFSNWPINAFSELQFLNRFAELSNKGTDPTITSVTDIPSGLRDLCVWDDFKAMVGLDAGLVETFVSKPGSITPLHTDLRDGVVTCAINPRTITLFPPSETNLLYPLPFLELGDFQQSYVRDPRTADSQRYPNIVSAQRLVVDLEPGDALMIPAGWFHFVTAGKVSVGMKVSYSVKDTLQTIR